MPSTIRAAEAVVAQAFCEWGRSHAQSNRWVAKRLLSEDIAFMKLMTWEADFVVISPLGIYENLLLFGIHLWTCKF